MPYRTALFALSLAWPALVHAAEVTVEGVNLERTVPCNGQDVGIYGSGNSIELTGDCGAIIVHGNGNSVTFENGASLTITGIDHAVQKGIVGALIVDGKGNIIDVSVENEGEGARVVISGAEHDVTLNLVSAADLVVNGLKHRVRWAILDDVPEPNIQIAGFDSTVEKSR